MIATSPFLEFLGVREETPDDATAAESGLAEPARRYVVDFREEYLGNPLIRTFHGGILASIGETVAAMHVAGHVARERGESALPESALPECATMTFDYLRPAFAKTLVAVAHTVRAGKRITTVSVQLRQEGQLVCIGRFLFPLGRG